MSTPLLERAVQNGKSARRRRALTTDREAQILGDLARPNIPRPARGSEFRIDDYSVDRVNDA
jgi:hypothetical protein